LLLEKGKLLGMKEADLRLRELLAWFRSIPIFWKLFGTCCFIWGCCWPWCC